jgi:hypothetical protein
LKEQLETQVETELLKEAEAVLLPRLQLLEVVSKLAENEVETEEAVFQLHLHHQPSHQFPPFFAPIAWLSSQVNNLRQQAPSELLGLCFLSFFWSFLPLRTSFHYHQQLLARQSLIV